MDPAKRDAVRKALAEHPTQSNKAISRIAGVSDHLVAAVRRLAAEPHQSQSRPQPYTCAACGAKYQKPSDHAVCSRRNSAA
jgi:hypothetical protein